MMLASFHQMTGIRLGDYEATITLIGRRGAQRPGVRHWRRGADHQVPPPPPGASSLGEMNCPCPRRCKTESSVSQKAPSEAVLACLCHLRTSKLIPQFVRAKACCMRHMRGRTLQWA